MQLGLTVLLILINPSSYTLVLIKGHSGIIYIFIWYAFSYYTSFGYSNNLIVLLTSVGFKFVVCVGLYIQVTIKFSN